MKFFLILNTETLPEGMHNEQLCEDKAHLTSTIEGWNKTGKFNKAYLKGKKLFHTIISVDKKGKEFEEDIEIGSYTEEADDFTNFKK